MAKASKPLKAKLVQEALAALASPERAKGSAWFFKTGPGQYGEGDRFIGVSVPEQRKIAKQFRALPLPEVATLLASPVHEHRLCALLILVLQYQTAKNAGEPERPIVDFYLEHLDHVNNWDLVDSSAPYILGDWIARHPGDAKVLTMLADSEELWRERVAMVATAALIRVGRFDATLTLAERFLVHPHDLMHKATGWMLREVGKQDEATLRRFLDAHAEVMPRTMLRYAIERLPDKDRTIYLKRKH